VQGNPGDTTTSGEVQNTKAKPRKKKAKVVLPQRKMGANSIKDRVPVKSRLVAVEGKDLLTEPITLTQNSMQPFRSIPNPDDVMPHDQIAPNIREAIITNYGEEFFRNKTWTVGIIRKLTRAISTPRENLTGALAQICGPKCAYKDLCPHDIVGRAPIGDRCPQEMALISLLYNEYMSSVSDRLRTDVQSLKEDIITHNLVMGLVEADIVSMRLDGTIASEGFISLAPAVVNETTGELYTKEEEAVAVRIKERVYRRRDQLYRQLLATPEMAEKYRRKEGADPLAKTASLLSRLEQLVTKVESKQITDGEVIGDSNVADRIPQTE